MRHFYSTENEIGDWTLPCSKQKCSVQAPSNQERNTMGIKSNGFNSDLLFNDPTSAAQLL